MLPFHPKSFRNPNNRLYVNFLQVPYTFGKQVSFDVFAGLFYALFDQYSDSIVWLEPHKKIVVSVSAAFVASLFACFFSQPGDMILTETYRRVDPGKQLSFPQVVDKIYSSGGIANFFTGTGARIVHVGLIITSQLVIYDIVKQLLGLPATGSH
jgi:solute carrier family 25 (mitochondrial phosphate transporter), member 3